MRWFVLLLFLVAACSQKAQVSENQASATEKITEANVVGNMSGVTVETANGASTSQTAKLPPADAALRFVGTWAANQGECLSKPWTFTEKSLSGKGAPKCSVYKVSKAPGGYDLAATCPAEEPVHNDLIRLRFAESAGAMLVESNAIPPTGLIYCGK